MSRNVLLSVVGITALVAPALHTASDVMEWHYQGFTDFQLWLTYVAFLPMPWLLLGIVAVQVPKPGMLGVVGALLYGVAFVYFTHSALYALAERFPTYEALWAKLGHVYTIHGGLMVFGGVLFAWSAFRVGWLPKVSVLLFFAGLTVNFVLALVPAPDILQIFGSAVRNLGLMTLGYNILSRCNQVEG